MDVGTRPGGSVLAYVSKLGMFMPIRGLLRKYGIIASDKIA